MTVPAPLGKNREAPASRPGTAGPPARAARSAGPPAPAARGMTTPGDAVPAGPRGSSGRSPDLSNRPPARSPRRLLLAVFDSSSAEPSAATCIRRLTGGLLAVTELPRLEDRVERLAHGRGHRGPRPAPDDLAQ